MNDDEEDAPDFATATKPIGVFRERPHFWDAQPLRDGGLCEHCEAKNKEAPSHLCRSVVHFLMVLRQVGRPILKCELVPQLDNSVNTNSGSTAYWGLATNSDNGEVRGPWRLTKRGLRFLDGELRIPATVIKFRSEVVRYEDEPLSVWEAARLCQADYAHFTKELYLGHATIDGLETLPKQKRKRRPPPKKS